MNQLITVKKVASSFLAMSRYSPLLQHRAATKAEAIAGVQRLLKSRSKKSKPVVIYLQHTKLISCKQYIVPISGVRRNPMAHAGIFSGQAAVVMQDICNEAYRLRKVVHTTESIE